jgi:uncharacterized protein YyaL (SSP411 family)
MSTHAAPEPHPFFDDKRAVLWHRSLPAALADAAEQQKRVFLCVGGPRCSATRALVERTIAKQEIGEYIGEHFVACAVDPEHAEADVKAIVAALPRHEPTPLCIFLTPEARVVHSTVAARPPAVLLTDMLEAVSRR